MARLRGISHPSFRLLVTSCWLRSRAGSKNQFLLFLDEFTASAAVGTATIAKTRSSEVVFAPDFGALQHLQDPEETTMSESAPADTVKVDRRVGGETGFFETVNILSKDNAGTPIGHTTQLSRGATVPEVIRPFYRCTSSTMLRRMRGIRWLRNRRR